MPRRSILFHSLLGLLLTGLLAQAQVPKDFRPNVAVLRSPHAEGMVPEDRARVALWYVAADLKIPLERIPRIVVVHVGRTDAGVAELPETGLSSDGKSSGVVQISPTENGEKLYYLWMIGKASDEILVRGIVQILYAPISLSDAETSAVAHRVLIRLRSVVNAGEFHSG